MSQELLEKLDKLFGGMNMNDVPEPLRGRIQNFNRNIYEEVANPPQDSRMRHRFEGEDYVGFQHVRSVRPSHLEHVAVVFVEDTYEVYAIEDPRKCSDLIRYLSDKGETVNIAGVYRRT